MFLHQCSKEELGFYIPWDFNHYNKKNTPLNQAEDEKNIKAKMKMKSNTFFKDFQQTHVVQQK